jgi:hypothetical protein
MEENLPFKKITFSQPEGSRKRGGPKLRWLDSVLKDVKTLKVEAWWKKGLDRSFWGLLSRRPKSIQDCRGRRRKIIPALIILGLLLNM